MRSAASINWISQSMRQKSSCKTGFCWQYMRLVKDLGLAEETKATCRVVLCHMLLIRLLGDGVHTGMWLYLSSLFPSSVMRRYVLTISFLGLSIHWEIVPKISIAFSLLGKVGYIFSEAGLWRIQEAYSPTFFSPFLCTWFPLPTGTKVFYTLVIFVLLHWFFTTHHQLLKSLQVMPIGHSSLMK